MQKRLLLVLIFSLAVLLALSLASGGAALATQSASATPEPANSAQGTDQPPGRGATPAPEGGKEPEPAPTDLLEGVLATRAPEPTPTPGRVEQQVEDLVDTIGLGRATFLGISIVNWVNLAISLLYVLAGYLIGSWLIWRVLADVVQRTVTKFDDQLLESIGGDLRWMVVILALYLASARLTFVRASLKRFLGDVYFIVALVLVVRVVFKVIDLADEWTRQRMTKAGREAELVHVRALLVRVGRAVSIGVAVIVFLAHFGVDVTALSAALGLGGLALTLAAQDTISDAIAGFIILFDQPFRIGDRIEIPGAGTWGDVLSIGLRTTRIRTRDNRVIILPNSTISSSQVTNYSYPDPSCRVETHLSVEANTDLDIARRLIVDTVSQVEGVVTSRPIDALYIDMGALGLTFRVRWWLESYIERNRNLDKVHTALQAAFDDAGIVFAPTTQSVRLEADPETVRRVASAFKGQRETDTGGETSA